MDENQQGVQLIESEEDKKKKGQPTQPGSAFAPTGPSASSVKPSATQQSRAEQAAGPTRGTGFTGVGRFLQANVGSRLGQQVAGRVSATGQEAASRLGQATQQFQEQLKQQRGQLTTQQAAAQSALQRIASGELTNVSPEQQAAYQSIASGGITAPTGLQDMEGVKSQAALAEQLARGTQTSRGRTGLLRQTVGRGPQQYTAGQSALDALILGQSGGDLAAARRSAAGLQRQASTQERLAEEQSRQFGIEAQRAKQEALGGAAGIERPLTTELEEKRKQFIKSREDLTTQLQEGLLKGELTKEQAEILGITGPTQTYGLTGPELSNLLKSSINPMDVTAQTLSTQEQAAKLNALYKLMGQKEFVTQEQLDKVGSIKDVKQGIQFDPEGSLAKAKESAEKQMTTVQNAALERPGIQSYVNRGLIKKDQQGRLDPESIKALLPQLRVDPEANPKLAAEIDFQKQLLNNYLNEYNKYYSGNLKIKPE